MKHLSLIVLTLTLGACGSSDPVDRITEPSIAFSGLEAESLRSGNACNESRFFGGKGTRIQITKNLHTKKQHTYHFVAGKDGFLDGPWHHNGRWQLEVVEALQETLVTIHAGTNRDKTSDFDVQLRVESPEMDASPEKLPLGTISGSVSLVPIDTHQSEIRGEGKEKRPYCIDLTKGSKAVRICWYCK